MIKRIGAICICLGVVCILSSVGFVIYNQWEDKSAEKVSKVLLQDVQSIIDKKIANDNTQQLPQDSEEMQGNTEKLPDDNGQIPNDSLQLPEEVEKEPENTEQLPQDTETPQKEMARIKVDGYDCVGILSIPVLNLKLPVLTDWSYAKLKIAPCVYYGSYYEPDFVIAAHNYKAHFRRLSELKSGDIVLFTDANGVEYIYEVVLMETLPKDATKEMITSGFDLSLYTCTTGRANRVTARCSLKETNK